MKRMAVILGALVLIADALDIISTYLATPDLALEWNPLVRSFGWGWEAIIILHAVVDALFIAWVWYFYKASPAPEEKPPELNTFSKTAVWYITGYHQKNKEMDLKRYMAFLGFIIPLGAVVNALCNAVLNFSFYLDYFSGLTEATYPVYTILKSIIIISGICLTFYFIIKKKYLKVK